MRKIFSTCVCVFAILSSTSFAYSGETLELLFSTRSIYGKQSAGVGFIGDKFQITVGIASGTKYNYASSVFDYAGKKLWEEDSSYWQELGAEYQVPDKNILIITERARCLNPSERVMDGCLSEVIGCAAAADSGKILYQSKKFARFEPVFSASGKYMLGQNGYGGPKDEMGEVAAATGTCLIETESGREIWCKEEVFSEDSSLLSEVAGLVIGERGVYGFSTGNRLAAFPQYAKKGEKHIKPKKAGNAIIARAISPDGKYWVVTEGRCDVDRVELRGVAEGCYIKELFDTETYLAEWANLGFKRIITTFEDASRERTNFAFLKNGLLLDNENRNLINMRGEKVLHIENPVFPINNYKELDEPDYNLEFGRITYRFAKSDEWKIFDFNGKLVNHFAWKDPSGRESHAANFKMTGIKDFLVVVHVPLKRNETGRTVLEEDVEVYKGRFE